MSSHASSVFFIAVAAVLAACASTAPGSGANAGAPPAINGETVNPGNRYQFVGKIEGENYYCQKQARTGSRANSNVRCIDQQMFEAYSKVGQDPTIQGPRSGGPLAGGTQ